MASKRTWKNWFKQHKYIFSVNWIWSRKYWSFKACCSCSWDPDCWSI